MVLAYALPQLCSTYGDSPASKLKAARAKLVPAE